MPEFKLSRQDQSRLEAFLRELVRTPSPPTQEGRVAERVIAEMNVLGLRDARVDRAGSAVGLLGPGHGPRLLLDCHMDTVGAGDRQAWQRDPFGAQVERGVLYGLGSCDAKGGLAAALYGAKLLRDAGVTLRGDLVVACVVQEEPCEGLGTRVLVEEEGIQPDWVVVVEPTGLDVSRGHRGRLELHILTGGRSAHSASPTLGENAIYPAARLVFGLELLAGQGANDAFMGAGTLAVTDISSCAVSRNAVPDQCRLVVDRRLTLGENETKALAELQRMISREVPQATLAVTEYDATSYTGYRCRARQSFPAWVMAENHPLVTTALQAVRAQARRRPQVTRTEFSTEGAYSAGVAGIPTVILGPGDPRLAHTVDEHVRLEDVFLAAEVYARLAWELLGE